MRPTSGALPSGLPRESPQFLGPLRARNLRALHCSIPHPLLENSSLLPQANILEKNDDSLIQHFFNLTYLLRILLALPGRAFRVSGSHGKLWFLTAIGRIECPKVVPLLSKCATVSSWGFPNDDWLLTQKVWPKGCHRIGQPSCTTSSNFTSKWLNSSGLRKALQDIEWKGMKKKAPCQVKVYCHYCWYVHLKRKRL